MCNHIVQNHIPTPKTVLRIGNRVVVRSGFEHTYKYGGLFCGNIFRCCVEVSLTSRFDSKGIRAEVYGIGVHRNDVFLIVKHFEFQGNNPFLAFHYKYANTRNLTNEPCGILCSHAKHILSQLLGDSRCTARIVMNECVFHCCKHSLEVNAEMMIEPFILSIYQSVPKLWVYLIVFDRSSVFIEVFSDELVVCTVNFGSL